MRTLRASILALLLVPLAVQAAGAACTPFLCYIDLGAGGTPVCPNSAVFSILRSDLVANTPYSPTCALNTWQAVVASVTIPAGCTGVSVWVQYSGEPEGFTVDIGDSQTDNGFGGDSSSLHAGHNAEVKIVEDNVEG